MAYNGDVKDQPPQPSYPQQTYPANQGSYTGNPGAYSNPNPQAAPQYGQTPYQQGAPYAGQPPPQGAQYPQGYQQPPPQAAPTQPIIVTQPQVVVGQPVMMMSQQCAPGQHVFNTHFGACGIIAAILLFPIGLIFLFIDQQRRCSRCGMAG